MNHKGFPKSHNNRLSFLAPFPGMLAATIAMTALLPGVAAHAQQPPVPPPQPVAPSTDFVVTPSGPVRIPYRAAATEGPLTAAPSPLRSVKGLTSVLDSINKAKKRKEDAQSKRIAAAKKHGLPLSDEDEEAALNKARGIHVDDDDDGDDAGEYLSAYLQQFRIRAYPHDTIDSSAYARAIAHRALMAPAKTYASIGSSAGTAGKGNASFAAALKPAAPAAPGAPVAQWTYIGPNNLPTPYVTYYGPTDYASILTGRVNGIAYDPTTPGTAYLVGAGGGVWKSTDYGQNWRVLSDGPAFPHLQASSVAVNPTNGRNLLVGMGDYDGYDGFGYSVGIMRSFDGGSTWSNVGNAQMGGASVSAIVFDPENPQLVTATSGRGSVAGQIWRSTDGGSTWSSVTGAPAGDWSSLTVGLKDSSSHRAYYASREGDGIYKSTDRGLTWAKLSLYLPLNNGVGGLVGLKVRCSVVDANTAYVVDGAVLPSGLGDGRIFKTTTGGSTWTDVTGTYFDGAAYNELNQLVNVPGQNWSQCWYDLQATTAAIPVVSNGVKTTLDTLYVGGITISGVLGPASNLWTDIGQTELNGGAITHSDQHAMAINPTDPTKALFGNDGGVYGLTFNTTNKTWSTSPNNGLLLNKTLGLTQIYHADFSLLSPSVVIMGTQDNASPAATGNLATWINPGAGDGAGCAINNTNNNLIQYNSIYDQEILHTTDKWQTEDDITYYNANGQAWDGDTLPFIGQLALSPEYPSFMFVGTNYLWLWDEDAQGYVEHIGGTQLATATGATVLAIACANQDSTIESTPLGFPSFAGVVYVSTTDGKLWMTINATATDTSGNSTAKWVEIDSPTTGTPLPKAVVSSISINPTNPFDILVGLSGTGTGHLYRCADTAGAPFLTYTNQSGLPGFASLPDIPLNDVTRDPNNPNNVFYVATDIGVFTTVDGGSSWQNATEPLGLPNVQCNVIKAPFPFTDPFTGVTTDNNPFLYVGTYGRGLWRIPLSAVSPPTAVAASISVKSGLARVNGVLEMSIVVTNTSGATGTAATNVQVTAATVTAAGKATSAAGLPLTIGTLPAGQSVTVTVLFPATAPKSGTVASTGGSITYSGGTVAIPPTTVRLP